jgi:hypothetical protein
LRFEIPFTWVCFLHIDLVSIFFFSSSSPSPPSSCNHAMTLGPALITKEGYNLKSFTNDAETYLGEDPDTLDGLEFLCLAEGEVTHYEVLDELAKEVKDKKFTSEVKSILREEKQHLQLCTQLARDNSSCFYILPY